mgnify:CR=1 FL=1
MRFRHESAALTTGKRTKLVERPRGEEHGRTRHAIETGAPNARNAVLRNIAPHGVMFRGTGDIGFRSITPSSGINVALHSIEPHSVVLRSIGQRCTDSIASHNIRNAAPRSIASRGTSSIALGGAKKRDDARWTNKRLVALDKRDRIAPVHGLHAQAHRVIPTRLVVQNHLRAQRLAQRSHVSMARDHHAPAEQTIGCSHNMADQRRVAKLSHEFITSETCSHARCHNDASVLQCAVVGSVWHSGIRLCKFDGWTG